jgi:CheY-like chemotaxis protein
LLLTAKVQAGEQHPLIDKGVTAVITKPFDPLTLANDIAEALGWQLCALA